MFSEKTPIFAFCNISPMLSLAEIQRPIAENIRHYEEFITSILRSDNAFVASICDYILARRGKQLRPLLVLLSAALHTNNDEL